MASALGCGLLLTLLLALFTTVIHGACFYPSGSLAPNDVPCRGNLGVGTAAACCGQGYACLSNGMCTPTGNELQEPGISSYVRGSCTDKNWANPGCPYFCIDPKINNLGGGHGVAKCQNTVDDRYYCIDGAHSEASCNKTGEFLYFSGEPSALTTIGVAASTTSTSTSLAVNTASSTTTPPAASTTATQATESAKDNTALIAGVVAGVLGGLILGGAAVWLIRRCLQHRKEQRAQNVVASAAADGAGNAYANATNNDLAKTAAEANQYYQQHQQEQTQAGQQGPHGTWNGGHKAELDAGQHSYIIGQAGPTVYEASTMRSPQELSASPREWR